MSEGDDSPAEQIFLRAIELDSAQRSSFLQSACGDDIELRADVESLLEAAKDASDYFEGLAGRLGAARVLRGGDVADNAQPGDLISAYRLTERVGSGGMGSVWCAERNDGRFEGRVAVKLLNRKARGGVMRRFDREAHYLARLTHPNIARLIDAGVDESDRPYLILEFVDGESIDRYCNSRSLAIEDRIRIFINVLEAVAHAHARLIVHSDIKPSNVLVAADGNVKLLDFGISRLLSEDDDSNSAAVHPGIALTPEFAAPEQFAEADVTTATDVYSLGLLLYQLLAGSSPRNLDGVRSMDELRAAATQAPASLVSTVAETHASSLQALATLAKERHVSPKHLLKVLRGDLDFIVRRALAVDPSERYATAADFASDLRRYLGCQTVAARPETFTYGASKFVQRHRGGVLSAALTVLALITAAGITSWQSVEARRQRDIAIYQQQRVQATNDFLNTLLGELGPGGQKLSLQELLDRGVSQLNVQHGTDERLLAMMLYEISVLYATLGQVDTQLELLDRASEISRGTGDEGLLANLLCAKARLKSVADPEDAGADLTAAKNIVANMPATRGATAMECYRAEGLIHSSAGDHEAAIAAYLEGIQALDAAPVSSAGLRLNLLNDLAEQYFLTDRPAEALGMLDEIIANRERIGRGRSVSHVIILMNRSAVLLRLGEVMRAADGQREALSRVKGMDNAPVAARGHYAGSLFRLAHYDEALELFETDYEAAVASGNQRWRAQIAMQIGRTLIRTRRTTEAVRFLDEAEAFFMKTPGAHQRQLLTVAVARAEALQIEGDLSGADANVQHILADLGYPARMDASGLASVLWQAAETALALGDYDRAAQYATDQLGLVTGMARDPEQSADVGQALLQKARATLVTAGPVVAGNDLRRAVRSLENGFGPNHPDTLEALRLLDNLTD
ncbi:MAG: serine/threonine protein kinase [Gammaproteobacteria bacterium]|nr:serine/threonine protein kinase [Gammaproteobacteria bacterium]MDH4314495.1 serine/threonine protein kinase [Gammaproteobacteria bacterium]MDH5214340.1 serine/threonine protein kinase [Gammaproteobacteria bacterium]